MSLEEKKGAPPHMNGQGGFNLVEVMVALAILAFGILAVASMQTASLSGASTARSVTEATNTGSDRVEKLIALPYTDAQLSAGAHGPVVDGRYTLNWQVSEGALLTNTKRITVTVQWTEKGAPKTSALTYVKMDVI